MLCFIYLCMYVICRFIFGLYRSVGKLLFCGCVGYGVNSLVIQVMIVL